MPYHQKAYSNKISNTCFHFHAWDTETLGLGGELVCLTACLDTPEHPVLFTGPSMIESFLLYAFQRPYTKKEKNVWFSHNLGYDLRYLIPYLVSQDSPYHIGEILLRTDSDIFCMEIIRGEQSIRVADSFAIFPQSLQSFASQFGREYQKLDGPNWDVEIFDEQNPEHIRYALSDAQSLLSSLQNYNHTLLSDYGTYAGWTAAGTAMRAWRRTIPEETYYNKSHEKATAFFRRGYYGGIVFLTSRDTHGNCRTYDINSSYPAQMRKGVPAGKPAKTYEYLPELPGFYECTYTVPEGIVIPILPYRDERGFLIWPFDGTHSAVLSTLEIDFAREHGYQIDIGEGYVFDDICYPFGEFIDTCETIRRDNRKTPRETVAKLMQNSLYGKFGTRPERRKICWVPSDSLDEIENKTLWGEPFATGAFYTWQESDQDMLCKPEWAAWITASARLTLLRTAYAIGPERVLYGDTDSLTVTADADTSCISLSEAYGDFKLEKTWEQFRALAPKVYAGIIEGVATGKSKGQSRKRMQHENYQELLLYGKTQVTELQLEGILQAMKRGAPKAAVSIIKNSTDIARSITYGARFHE